jgi:hypothetical protein
MLAAAGVLAGCAPDRVVQGRPYALTIPAGTAPTTALPMVVFLHGYTGNGVFDDLQLAKLRDQADTRKFIYVQPNGTPHSRGARPPERRGSLAAAAGDAAGAGTAGASRGHRRRQARARPPRRPPPLGWAPAGRRRGRAPGPGPWLQTEVGVPLFYGVQTTRREYVASVWAAYRALFPSVGGAQHLATVNSVRYGVALGAFRRAPAGWGFQIGYDTDSDPFAGGALHAPFGWFWDLPARGQPR